MWTPTTRRQHSRTGLRYGSDLTDTEWAILAPFLPTAATCGRKRAWPMREIVNAICYVLRGGIAWRLLPDSFPPWRTVYRWFARLRDDGTWETINHHLVMRDRERAGPLLRASRPRWPFVQLAFADSAYQGPRVAAASSIRGEIVHKPDGQVGFAVHARRWVVERFFAWINRNRRLAKDVEATIASAEAFLYAASAILLLRRLARR
jgi:transposase